CSPRAWLTAILRTTSHETALSGAPGRRTGSHRDVAIGRGMSPCGASGRYPNRRSAFYRTSRVRTWLRLGCGTAYVSAWLARAGARPVGLDPTAAQLASASKFQLEFGLRFPLLLATAEAVPLATERFDLAVSEYGACLWADPLRWIPESARLLRPGGRLIFLTSASLPTLCMSEEGAGGDRLLRAGFGIFRMTWWDSPGIEFPLSHGEWTRLLRANGFDLEDLIGVRPPANAATRFPHVPLE